MSLKKPKAVGGTQHEGENRQGRLVAGYCIRQRKKVKGQREGTKKKTEDTGGFGGLLIAGKQHGG